MTQKPSPDPWNPRWDGPKELLPLLAAGKLEQTCPNCGKSEPAGGPCSRCGQASDWYHWHKPARSPSQIAHTEQMRIQHLERAQQAESAQENRSQGISEEV